MWDGRTLDALRPTRFQREAAVSGLGSSKKETVLWLSRAKSRACHLHHIIDGNHKPSVSIKALFPRNEEAGLMSTSVTMNKNKIRHRNRFVDFLGRKPTRGAGVQCSAERIKIEEEAKVCVVTTKGATFYYLFSLR